MKKAITCNRVVVRAPRPGKAADAAVRRSLARKSTLYALSIRFAGALKNLVRR